MYQVATSWREQFCNRLQSSPSPSREEDLPHLCQVVGLPPADAEGAAHCLPGSVPVDATSLGLPQDRGLGLPGALIKATKVEKEVDKLLIGEVWYAR